MRPKTYATLLVTGAATLFLGVASANLIIDPQGVFGTGLLHPSPNVNLRFLRFTTYQKASAQYEGLLLGSSRADIGIRIEDLSSLTGVKFASFAVGAGRLEDHALVLDFVVRQKRRDGERLRTVFLLLDVDRFGDPPLPVKELLQPPALTGDSPARFWWRNVTVIQWKAWWFDILQAWKRMQGPQPPSAQSAAVGGVPADLLSGFTAGVAQAQAGGVPMRRGLDPITGTRHFADQIELLAHIAALCSENGVELLAAVPPISRSDAAKVDRADLSEAVERVSRIVPVWDFSAEEWLWEHPGYWVDTTHFHPVVGRNMLARVFGQPLEERWSLFGRLRSWQVEQRERRRLQRR